MASIDNISVQGFKSLFPDFPYLPLYVSGKAYFKDDIVYYDLNFYQSQIDRNTSTPFPPIIIKSVNMKQFDDPDAWQLIKDDVSNYIQDSDITRAFGEAKVNFNANLFKDDAAAEMVFYYLTAHYLVIDTNNRINPLAMGFQGFTQSKSVGSVSESYAVPQWMLNNETLGAYAQTGFGRKYLSLIRPYLTGNIMLIPGRTTYG